MLFRFFRWKRDRRMRQQVNTLYTAQFGPPPVAPGPPGPQYPPGPYGPPPPAQGPVCPTCGRP
ncbi:hypothetical protein GCM10010411_49960 [Actinomadura fulvescens]|uniref:Uncharacterized protein n=1 Tax=Actinomadura fulvescens TaxID=46160 RepID=A0ABP6C9U4_9ACTN